MRQASEELLVELYDIIARQRVDIGINYDCKINLTPIDESSAYSQNLPKTINLKADITVEIDLMPEYGIITTLPFSKYASLVSAQKPTDKKSLFVDLRKINNQPEDR